MIKIILSIFLATTEVYANGLTVYSTNCASCHGDKLDGNGTVGQYLTPRPRNLLKDKFKNGDSPEQIFKTVTNGLEDTAMPAFGSKLSEADRKAVSNYIASLRKK